MFDKELITKIQSLDSHAAKAREFDKLIVKYTNRIQQLTISYLKDKQDAEEAAQDTFIKAYKYLDNFRNDSKFYTWLHRIAINTCNRMLENRARQRVDTVDTVDEVAAAATPESTLVEEELSAILTDTIENLPPKYKDVFTLRCVDELSYADIAQQLNIPVGTVRSRLSRAKTMLNTAIS